MSRNRKKTSVPLSNLRTSEVVRAVVDHPRRLAELLSMLDDKNRSIRGRAAATLARLSETHAGRLVRVVERLKEGLSDDSAYVRWCLAYALGRTGSSHPHLIPRVLMDLTARLDDDNRVVRLLTYRAMKRLIACKPQLIKTLFEANKQVMPEAILRAVKDAERRISRASNCR